MILEAIVIGTMIGQYIYHRLTDPGPPKPTDRIKVPLMAEGAIIPMVYGTCRSRAPVIAWYGNETATARAGQPDGSYYYTIDMMFVIGMPFFDGTTLLQGIYVDGSAVGAGSLEDLAPNLAGSEYVWNNGPIVGIESPQFSEALVEFGDGNSSQTMVGSTAATRMVAHGVDSAIIPGYRGYVTAFFHNLNRNSPQLPTFNFVVSSFPFTSYDATSIGDDANPIDVLADILKSKFGKLGIDPALIDYETFRAAAETLTNEVHGYSMAIDGGGEAREIVDDILKQIDAILYEDPIDAKWKIKLVRDDYTVDNTLLIGPDNCSKLDIAAVGGWSGRVNKVRVVFTDRANDYEDGSATAQNQANAVGQDGVVEEVVLQMPGICTQALANTVAARELSALSRPLLKCTAIVSRDFLRTVPGDVVRLYWPKWNIGTTTTMFLRVAGVTRGSLVDGAIQLELIQDFHDGTLLGAFEALE